MDNKSFQDDLSYSHLASDDKIFEAYYRQKFDNVISVKKVESIKQQKLGIDKVIYQTENRWITIDEKKRRECYKDILIEILHCHKHDRETWKDKPKTLDDSYSRTPTRNGWIYKNNCDFLVYAIMPSRMLYLLPFKLLVIAIRRNLTEWEKFPKQFPIISSGKNPGYWSVNIGVPPDILFAALEKEMTDTFDNQPPFAKPEAIRYGVEPSGQIYFRFISYPKKENL